MLIPDKIVDKICLTNILYFSIEITKLKLREKMIDIKILGVPYKKH